MHEIATERRFGAMLVVGAAVAWSTAPFFTQLLPFDAWTILFWRGLFGGGLIAAFLAISKGGAALRELVMMTAGGWTVTILSTLAMVAFIPALQMTRVANVAIIIATQPFVAAALAWIWFREVARTRTLALSLVALIGVATTVSDAQGAADVRGIALACVMILAISAMTVAMRRYKQTSMVAAAAMSNFLGSLISIPFATAITHVSASDLSVLAMFGFFQVALGLTLFSLGSRLLPSSQSSLIATLETPLMPFWVWLAFHEVPTVRALAGGALVMGAVVCDILVDSRTGPHPATAVSDETSV